MEKKEKEIKNEVEITGKLFSIVTEDLSVSKGKRVFMEIFTPENSQDKNSGFFHRVKCELDPYEAKNIIEKTEKVRDGKYIVTSTPIAISVKGSLSSNKEGEVFVQAKEISFTKEDKTRNSIKLSGKIIDTSNNRAYANVLIGTYDHQGQYREIPSLLKKSTDHQKWAELGPGGKLRKNSFISLEGNLLSKHYSNGEDKIFMCAVNIQKCEISLAKTKEKERKPQQVSSL